MNVWLERLLIVVASLLLSIGLIILLSGYFTSRDQAGVTGEQSSIGISFPDLGDAHLKPGDLRPLYNSIPPTSGAHFVEPVLRDNEQLSDDQLLEALAAGDVVIMYGTKHPPPGLQQLASQLAGHFTPDLAASGQAVILARRPGTRGLLGLAWTHLVSVGGSNNPQLREFAQVWLGKGSDGH